MTSSSSHTASTRGTRAGVGSSARSRRASRSTSWALGGSGGRGGRRSTRSRAAVAFDQIGHIGVPVADRLRLDLPGAEIVLVEEGAQGLQHEQRRACAGRHVRMALDNVVRCDCCTHRLARYTESGQLRCRAGSRSWFRRRSCRAEPDGRKSGRADRNIAPANVSQPQCPTYTALISQRIQNTYADPARLRRDRLRRPGAGHGERIPHAGDVLRGPDATCSK